MMSTDVSDPPDPSRISASRLADDRQRLNALRRYDILDTDPEPAFDRIARLAAHVFDAPLAFVSFLDADRQWFKSCVGFAQRETPLEMSFCVHSLPLSEPLIIPDATEDTRVADNPFVINDPGIRFYAGAPLTTPDGHQIGTLCVLDTTPRTVSSDRCERLEDLAALVMDELELRREVAQRKQAEAMLRAINENISESIYRSTPDGTVLYANQAMAACFGYESPDALRRVSARRLYATPEERAKVRNLLKADGTVEMKEIRFRRADGSTFIGRLNAETVYASDGSVAYYDGVVIDITQEKEAKRALRRSAERWERLVEAHPEPIHVSVDGTIRYVNPAGAEAYGASHPEEVIGKSVHDFIVDEGDAHTTISRRAAQVYDQRDSTPPREFTIERLDGKRRTVEVRSVPIEYNGQTAAQTIVRDVTMQRRLEEKLEVRQHQFRQLLDNAQPVVFVIDAEGKFLVSEGRDLESLGLDPGEVVGESIYDLYGDVPEIIDQIERSLDGETVHDIIQYRDVTFDIWYAPIQDSQGETFGCIGMAIDITERRRAEAALREERDLLASIFNTSAAAITVLDTEGNIVKANERAEEILGLSASEIVGRSYDAPEWAHESVDGGPFPDDEQPFLRVMKTEQPVYDVQHAIRWPDGRRKVLSINGAPIHDAEGTTTGAVFIVDDITAQKRQRQQLRASQTRYQTLVDNFPEGAVFLFDDDLNHILGGGSELSKLGLSPQDIAGKSPSDLFSEHMAHTMTRHYQQALHGTSSLFEHEYRNAYYRVHTLPLHDEKSGSRTGMAVLQNITEDVRVEAMLRQAKQDAEEAARLKSSMLANMSHEVRTPLTSIIGFAEVLAKETHGMSQNFSNLILRGGKRLLTTLDSVLHLSRLEAGKESIQHETVDLYVLAHEILDEGMLQAEAQGMTVRLMPTPKPVEIRTDRGAVQRILTNLISNAIKYTERGGHVEVRVVAGSAGALLEVEDTGIGMDPDFRSRMFDAFTQESAGIRRKHEGSGLGLAIVQKLTSLLNGTIEVESTPGHGTRIAVLLPRPSETAPRSHRPLRSASSGR